ncbi:MAG: OmpA family protein [Bacteroidota bacterium]|nr:OmpA family protein [Bacteroidota bacterium]
MKRIILFSFIAVASLTSCVSKKKYTALQEEKQQTEADLSQAKMELAKCLDDQKKTAQEIEYLKNTNYKLLNSVGEMATLSKKEAENLERSLESMKEKDMKIQTMQDAINKKDSVTLALVTSLKGVLGDMSDDDVQINVEKGVVFISISDKLLFRSGSTGISKEARDVLGKVAKVLQNKPDIEIMVEGHTDDVPIKTEGILDNWDLSVKRATAIVRVLQNDFNVDPKRMTAAGRSYYLPVASNDTKEGRAANRRTRIVVLPKLDQFYGMIEEGMKKSK